MPMVAGRPLTKADITLFGQRLGADALLVGTVEVYKERSGSAMGLDRPQDAAEVGFAAQLASVKDGVPLWNGQYYDVNGRPPKTFQGYSNEGHAILRSSSLQVRPSTMFCASFPLGSLLKSHRALPRPYRDCYPCHRS